MLKLAQPASEQLEPVDRFEALFSSLYGDIYMLVYRVLGEPMASEDIVQEAFLKLNDHGAVQLRPESEVAAWLRRVALRLAFNWRR
ncbi:MAG: hypothetical protein M3336_00700, partial [Chloroflexota bacterium]|nr:hypothetical protein [Chloroflexota bacterium]